MVSYKIFILSAHQFTFVNVIAYKNYLYSPDLRKMTHPHRCLIDSANEQ